MKCIANQISSDALDETEAGRSKREAIQPHNNLLNEADLGEQEVHLLLRCIERHVVHVPEQDVTKIHRRTNVANVHSGRSFEAGHPVLSRPTHLQIERSKKQASGQAVGLGVAPWH